MADNPSELSVRELVKIGAAPSSKEAAIRETAGMLAEAGAVLPAYGQSMLEREKVANTYLGSGVAIPHGMVGDKNLVKKDRLAILQVPGGLTWNPGQTVYLVVGIAAKSDSHLAVLRRLTRLLQNEPLLKELFATGDPQKIVAALSRDEAPQNLPRAEDLSQKIKWTVDYPAGLHARPAALWVEAAKSLGAPIRVRHGNETAEAKSLISLLQLGLKEGDEIYVSTESPNGPDVLARFKQIIEGISPSEKAEAQRAAAREAEKGPHRGWDGPSGALVGVAAAPGLAVGRVRLLEARELNVPDLPLPLKEGAARLDEALKGCGQEMAALVEETTRRLGPDEAAIFKAQAELLRDAEVLGLASQHLVGGHGPAWAWHQAVESLAGKLASLGNPLLAARAADLRDVGLKVLLRLEPALKKTFGETSFEEQSVIVAPDLSPSDTAGLAPAKVAALATALGGPTSHTAILARTLGLPSVVALGQNILGAKNGQWAIVDGDGGRVYLDPSEEALASARAYMAELEKKRAAEEAERGLPAETLDGRVVAIGANINRPSQMPEALSQGASGVGLMRTEFLFIEQSQSPTENEQYEIYRDMLKAAGRGSVIIRALDIGGDKKVPHLNLPDEENPFLGVRGARLLLRRPDLLEPQVRALYRAAREQEGLQVMFPMISALGEFMELKKICEKIRFELNAPKVPLGLMIEVPSAALLSDLFAREADFFSIGTNDLTQYTLAMDRQNPQLAREADALNPAVLRMIERTVSGAKRFERFVGVCGGLAGDPFGAVLLSGLGVDELSMSPRDIPAVKARLRRGRQADFAALAQKALSCQSAEEVRALDKTFDDEPSDKEARP